MPRAANPNPNPTTAAPRRRRRTTAAPTRPPQPPAPQLALDGAALGGQLVAAVGHRRAAAILRQAQAEVAVHVRRAARADAPGQQLLPFPAAA